MANKKFSEFTSANVIAGSNQWVGLQSGINVKGTWTQALTFMNANAQITEAQVTNLVSDLAAKLNRSGGTMTGPLILNADPALALEAATKQYVDTLSLNLDLQTVYDQSTPKEIELTNDGLIFLNTSNAQIFFIDDNGNGSRLPFSVLIGSATSIQEGNNDSHTILSTTTPDSNFYNRKYNAWVSDNTLPASNALIENIGYHCDSPGDESAFYELQLKSNGSLISFLKLYGSFEPTSDPKDTMKQGYLDIDQFRIGSTAPENYVSMFDVFSPLNNSGSRPFPRLTDAQIGSIDISTTNQTLPVSLGAYNTTYDVIKYLASDSNFKTLLTTQKCINGSNMALVQNADGSVTFNATTGGGAVDLSQCQITANDNTFQTAVGGSFTPIIIDPDSWIAPIREIGMIGVLHSVIAGVTPAMKSISAGTRWFDVTFELSIKSNATLVNNYVFSLAIVPQAGSPILTTNYYVADYFSSTNSGGSVTVSGLVPMNENDTVYVVVLDTALFDYIIVTNVAAKAVDTSTNGIAGTTGNFAVFSSGGGVQDGGIFDGNTFTPTLTAVAGISGTPTLINSSFTRNKNIVSGVTEGTFVATDSTVTLGINLPVASTFTLSSQASGIGSLYDQSSPSAFDGSVSNVVADVANSRLQANLISVIGSGTKHFTVMWQYQIL